MHLKQTQSAVTTIVSDNPALVCTLATGLQIPATAEGNEVRLQNTAPETIAALNVQLVQNQIKVYQIYTGKNDLESIFIDLTQKQA